MENPRKYCHTSDLEAMRELLQAGRKAHNGSYYVHTGDLSWWLYYPPLDADLWDQIYLWDDPSQPGRLLAWVLLTPDWVGFDVYVQPELRGSPFARQVVVWAEEQALRIARESGKPMIHVLWVLHTDGILDDHFKQRGYQRRKPCAQLARDLKAELPAVQVPPGFTVRSCRGEAEVRQRANAQYGAFGSTADFDRYMERFTRFMRSTVYDPQLDIVVVNPEGQIGAFCIVWTDPINRVGLFEPVGTHPEFQRQGLGRVVMIEGLHRLRERGMESAIVSTGEENLPAIKLYESAGFQFMDRLGIYEKEV